MNIVYKIKYILNSKMYKKINEKIYILKKIIKTQTIFFFQSKGFLLAVYMSHLVFFNACII